MKHHDQRAAAVILAAGLGTRMKSALPKTLHPVLGRPMVAHVAATAEAAGLDPVVVVVGPEMSAVADAVPGAPHRGPARAQGHGARRPPGPRSPPGLRRHCGGALWRHAPDHRRDGRAPDPHPRGAGSGCGGSRLPRGRSRHLWASDHRRRRAAGHRRGQGSDGGAVADRSVQLRRHGLRR